ncbi:RagB/SusD family nutrient uptake outer membrane protein [Sphingobacterium paludis]|uniref:SusD-like starch-binding protein associating with outer membrane n=1 Tax=Sphingobacterium paludis TaxID=1476465 RepID=A0A4R7D2Y9_9SPHI|nr:RagB/SusD family nutrient uptake outer membrane protein [Sphingobacterium paludis]TDS13954.1 SusD-like starch-binding protein associating with outer membrane [Sphingobacterium paludis]
MRFKNIFYVSVLSLALAACGNKLELLPEQDLSDEIVFNNVGTTESALRGIYSTAQELDFYGSLPQLINDYMGNTVDFVGTFPTLQDLNNFSAVSINSNVQTIWQVHYEVILQANRMIAKAPGVPGITQEQIDQFTGEAKFMRALAYFQLANLFSQPFQVSNGSNLCVPLVLEEFSGEVTYPSRATLNDVHAAIESDLNDATNLLPEGYSSPEDNIGRATKGAAFGLLSRLHLYRDQNDLATSAAQSAIDLGYPLTSSVDVFTIVNSAIDNGRTGSGGWAAYYNPAALGGRGDAPFSAELLALFQQEPTDTRFAAKITGVAADGLSHFFTTKYPDAVTNSDNSPVLRTAELYLNKAEALAKASSGISDEAVTILNAIRSKSSLAAKSVTSKNELIDLILVERNKELAFEGHSRMDLLRNRRNLRSNQANAAFGAPKTILPIPQREIDNNSGLRGQQNEGY